MKWQRARQSQNVEDRRGPGGGGRMPIRGGGLGIGGILVVVLIGWAMGINPMEMLGLLSQPQGGGVPGQSTPAAAPGNAGQTETAADPNDPQRAFVASILGDTEDVWGAVFQQSGQTYPAPRLVLFSGAVQSACGQATSAVGPFYCPGDRQVYIDLGFFDEMRTRLGGGGDFAEAYVIAHEVGHHIQTITGVSARVNAARRRGENIEGDGGLLVRQELQADCYAGVWAHHAQARHQWLEPGDIEEALATATAIGDDALQRQARGVVVPDSFSHGTSEQRVRWFTRGFESGRPDDCDTFAAAAL
jgi:predicted metalloprotease